MKQPTKITDLLINKEIIRQTINHIKNHEPGNKPLLLWGPTGIGKTTLIKLTAQHLKTEIYELNLDDEKTKEETEKELKNVSTNQTLFQKKRLILIEDIDSISSKEKEIITTIINTTKKSAHPVIITATNYYDPIIRMLRDKVKPLEIIPAPDHEIQQKTSIKILRLIKKSNYDYRTVINDLLVDEDYESNKIKKQNSKTITQKFYKSKNIKQALLTLQECNDDEDYLTHWIKHNIPINAPLSNYEYASKSDVQKGRIIKTGYYGLIPYAKALLTGVTLKAEYKYIAYPERVRMNKNTKNLLRTAAKKIGQKIHESPQKILEHYLGVIRTMSDEELENQYKLTKTEIQTLRNH